jgi:hypothetical protein
LVKKIIKLSNSTLLGIFKYYVKNAEWYPIYLIQSGVGLDEAVKIENINSTVFPKFTKSKEFLCLLKKSFCRIL